MARSVGQGLVTGAGYPDAWSPTENVRWKTPLSGDGNSSPVVWGDRVFLTSAYDNGRRVSVVAFRRSDGTKLWERLRPQVERIRQSLQERHASATPATDGQRVYASFGARGLVAFDMDGKLVWHRDLGPMEAYHGTAGSPLLYKDRLILYQDQFARVVHCRVRRPHRQGVVAHQARRRHRLGHADRRSRCRSRRNHREQPTARAGVQPGHRRRAVALQRHHVRGHSYSRRRIRDGVLLVGPRRSDARDQARWQGRRDPHPRAVDESARLTVRAVANPVRRISLHGQRHGQHRHVSRGD
jgi:hypothetical protein